MLYLSELMQSKRVLLEADDGATSSGKRSVLVGVDGSAQDVWISATGNLQNFQIQSSSKIFVEKFENNNIIFGFFSARWRFCVDFEHKSSPNLALDGPDPWTGD